MTGLSDAAIARLRAAAVWPELGDARYTVVEEIGRGGMATVYLAKDETLDREVAIKVSHAVPAPGQPDEALERRIQLEARILARLEHPGIVPIHDVGRLADGRLYYVMKRVRGRTLLELLREDAGNDATPPRDREAERLRIFERICDPVAFAHAHGCIHRDLKPENVMVGAFGEVMVMDWGVAKLTGSVERSGVVLGTPGFMSPEQATGDTRVVDERSDVYGLGAILFTLLADEPPPASAEEAATALAGHPRIPAALRAICAKALAPRPADRYASVLALAADVSRYRAGHAVAAHRETFVERTARFARTYRTPILLVLAYMIMRLIVATVAGR